MQALQKFVVYACFVSNDATNYIYKCKYAASKRYTRTRIELLSYFYCATLCSVHVLQPSSIRRLATPWTYFLHLSLSSAILTDSSTVSSVHVLMLSIQAVRGLPRLRAPGIVPCVIYFSMQLHFSSWRDHSMLASLLWQSLIVPSLLRLCSGPNPFGFFAVHETRSIFLSPFISKASRRFSSFFLSVRLSQPYVATGHTIRIHNGWGQLPPSLKAKLNQTVLTREFPVLNVYILV